MFDEITAKCRANEIREALWGRAQNAVTWMSQSQNFTVTTSLMSMVGYVIGLGDRHPSNIMVQRETGKVIHIDFGDSFESARRRKKFPEKVPFRLTRMIVNALDSGTVEGIFRKTCEDIMWVLRDSKGSLVALLEIFVHEPLDELESQGKRRFQTEIIDQVAQKLMGKDRILSIDDSDLDIEGQVDALIREASTHRTTLHIMKVGARFGEGLDVLIVCLPRRKSGTYVKRIYKTTNIDMDSKCLAKTS
jgi:phosphatidylinositol kinase/protein kinase (PI-3  family)